MTAPVQWSKDNPFVDQTEGTDSTWSSDNPFIDHAQQPVAAAESQTPAVADESSSGLRGAARGAGRAIKEMAQGTAQFFSDVGAPLAPPKISPDLSTATPPETHGGLELLKEAVLGPIQATIGGAQELVTGKTAEEKAHGAVTALGGAAAIAGGVHGIKKGIGKLRGEPKPTAEAPVASPTEVTTPETPATPPPAGELPKSFADATPEMRKAMLEQLAVQAKETIAKKKSSTINTLKAIQTWSTLSIEQRKTIVPGLALTDYAKTWKELDAETRGVVMKSLNLTEPASGTNLDTSKPAEAEQANLSGPSGQGEVVPPPVPAIPEQGIPVATGEAPKPGEVIAKASGKTPAEVEAILRKKRSTGEGKALFDKIDQQPDITPPVEPAPPTGAEGKVVGSISPEAKQYVGKRYVNPERPDYSAVITKNTKPGEKPWRVSYFKTDEQGRVQTYLHNAFDTPKEAHDWVTGKPDTPGDKLKGYVEQTVPKLPTPDEAMAERAKATDEKIDQTAKDKLNEYQKFFKEQTDALNSIDPEGTMSPEEAKIEADIRGLDIRPPYERPEASAVFKEYMDALEQKKSLPKAYREQKVGEAQKVVDDAVAKYQEARKTNSFNSRAAENARRAITDAKYELRKIRDLYGVEEPPKSGIYNAVAKKYRDAGIDYEPPSNPGAKFLVDSKVIGKIKEYYDHTRVIPEGFTDKYFEWIKKRDSIIEDLSTLIPEKDLQKYFSEGFDLRTSESVDQILYHALNEQRGVLAKQLDAAKDLRHFIQDQIEGVDEGMYHIDSSSIKDLAGFKEVIDKLDEIASDPKVALNELNKVDELIGKLEKQQAAVEGITRKGPPEGDAGTGAAKPTQPQDAGGPAGASPEVPQGETPPGAEGTLKLSEGEKPKTMGQMSLEELQAELLDAEQRFESSGRQGTADLIDALKEEIASRTQPTEMTPERLDKIEQSIEDKTAVEKLIREPPPPDANKFRTLEEADNAIDLADEALDKGEITQAEHEHTLMEIANQKRELKAKSAKPVANVPPKFKMPDTVGKDLNKFSNDQLNNTKRSISALLKDPNIAKSPEAKTLRSEIDRILDYEAEVKRQSEGPAGPALATKKIEVEGKPKFEQYWERKVLTNASLKRPINFVKVIRQIYQGWIRPSHSLDVAQRLFEATTGEKIATHKSAARLLEMSDGSLTKAEAYLSGAGPFIPDGQGGVVPTGAKSLADILVNTARGDVANFDQLWAARRAVDVMAKKGKSIGIDIGYAHEKIINSSAELHRAVDEVRQYHSSLSLYALIKGLISPETRAAMELETSYGPIQRMYGPGEAVSRLAEIIKATGKTAKQIAASDEFKRLKGSDLPMRGMTEATLDVTHRIIRAADQNEVARTLVNMAKEKPELYKGMIERFSHREHIQIMQDLSARAQAVKALFDDVGIDISDKNANLFANMLSDDAMSAKSGKLLVWENGKIEAWRVDGLIADALKSMNPSELGWFVKMMGAPARVARIGIVLDPAFMMGQILNDQFQGWFNTRYGFTPFLDTFKGWWNIVHNTEAFKEALRAGGIEKSALRGRTTLGDLLAGPAVSPGELAFNQIKTGHPLRALQTIVTPLREATRMGEYLKARGRGATAIEAAWSARDLLGNYSVQGTFAKVRALNYMSLFLNPALQVMDKTARTIKERPGQWFTRASTLAGISALLYYAQKDDEDIRRLRQTPGGQRWWFIRMPGDNTIVKIRKPYFEGAVFASGIENVLDSWEGSNDEAFKLWSTSIGQELTLNMLPVMGVVPASIYYNKDLHSGTPIIPDRQSELDPAFQTGYYSGSAERIVGKTIGVPPALLSYVTRGVTGYLGESAVKVVSAALDWRNSGELPPKEDLPLMQRVFAKYPAYGTKPIRDFYDLAVDVDRAAKTIEFAAQHSPDDLEGVLAAHQNDLPLIELFNETRKQISDLRAGIQNIEDLKDLGPQSKKLYTDEFLKQIIDLTEATVMVAKEIKKSQGQ